MKPTITKRRLTKRAYCEMLFDFILSGTCYLELPSHWEPFLLKQSNANLPAGEIKKVQRLLQREARTLRAKHLSCVRAINPPRCRNYFGQSITCFVFDAIQ